jgi:hypothetical protein
MDFIGLEFEKSINDLGIVKETQCIHNLNEIKIFFIWDLSKYPKRSIKTKTIETKRVKTEKVAHCFNREKMG